MSLFERGGYWYFLFYQHGKRYKGSTGIRVAGRAAERKAETVFHDKRRAVENGESLKPRRAPLVRDYLKDFSEWVKSTNRANKTKADYLNGCRLILATPLAGMRMDQVTDVDISSTRFTPDTPYSTNSALRTLRRAFHVAQKKKVLRDIPEIKLVDAPRREVMVSITDELRLLKAIEYADANRRYKKREPAPLHEIFTIMLDCGMRPSEVVSMRREFVYLAEAFYFNPAGKTKKSRRRVPLSDRVLAILRCRMQGDQREGWIFPSAKSRSGHVELRALQRRFRDLAGQLGIPDDLKLYCARHTFGTVTMAETRDPALVRDIMGHQDLKTTMTYMHPDVDRVKTIIDGRNESKMVQ